jgi:hypothetical protein
MKVLADLLFMKSWPVINMVAANTMASTALANWDILPIRIQMHRK